jgi:hypothetical protein
LAMDEKRTKGNEGIEMKKVIKITGLIAALFSCFLILYCGDGDDSDWEGDAIPYSEIYFSGECIDNDGDGYGSFCYNGQDCDDNDTNNWNSCYTCADADGDMWFVGCDRYETINGPDECDDDGFNWTANGCLNCADADGDSFRGTGCDLAEDCDDTDDSIFPGALELACDGIDNNCSGVIDEVEEVVFADADLETAIKPELGLASSDTVYNYHFCGVTHIDLSVSGIIWLDGLEYAVDTTYLDLYDNYIIDISPLSGLASLTYLDLGYNYIIDISPLSSLSSLTYLDLYDNYISDISPLSGLTSVTYLDLGLNYIQDIQPLVANAGLGSGDNIYLYDNPLTCTSCCDHITALTDRGASVDSGTSCDGYTCPCP